MRKNQEGFILIVALMLLVIVTILVVNGMRSTTMNEKMAGNYMDRNRAFQAAEQGIRQASAFLQSNADACLSGCTNSNTSGSGPLVTSIPATWSNTYARDVSLGTGQLSSAKYLINQLPTTFLPTDGSKASCIPYSIMSRGQGIDSRSVVILQSTAFVCPTS
ncbi:hypothetical protein HQ393_13660 [Chitinibacter bivalviorum]|uniref:Type IV pilus assembly protein PilX n=1 Tax=Chitinibacter bivalviorum TaxID=2739434 RepID=A0A7H9BLG5_9NEIS|nr:PilX N-terminal domain-containing pilus assembly protein [Chitinibacter bivalviorum]QLG89206.1 hypothetical protein HQ393_13660 [Chitinibacter bivalviorum]